MKYYRSFISFEIQDKPQCYVWQWSLYACFIIQARGYCYIYFLLLPCTALHNCSSLGSLVFATIGVLIKHKVRYLQLRILLQMFILIY